ncbi:MAG: response regulator [bacterium]
MKPQIKVLIIEDNPDHALLARTYLETKNMSVTTLETPEKCLQLLRHRQFDIVLLDYHLPNEDGLAILKRLRKDESAEVPIVLVTGHGHEQVAVDAMKAGAFDYVVKSHDFPENLPEVVARVLQKFQMYQEKRRIEAEMRQRNKELQVLHSVTEGLNQSLILDEILQNAVDKIAQTLDLRAVAVYLLDRPANVLMIRTGIGAFKEIQALNRIDVDTTERLRDAILNNSRCIIDDLWANNSAFFADLVAQDLCAFMALPLLHQGRLLGMFMAGSKVRKFFTERRLNLLSSISNQISTAIVNANLYSETDKLKRQLEDVLHSSLDLIITIDGEGVIRFHNDRFAKTYGPAGNILDRTFADFLAESSRACYHEKLHELKSGKASVYEAEMVRPDGTAMSCLISQSALRGREEFLLVIKDISRIVQLQSQLIQAEKLSALGQMIAGAAHELNNPLAGILGYTQLLLEEDLQDSVRRDIGVIQKEAKRCHEIVKNLLTFARKQRSKQQLIDFNKLVASVLESRAYQLHAEGIEVTRDLAASLAEVLGDYDQLQQVILHLLNNAREALKANGTLKKCLRLSTERGSGTIRLRITDNGVGIPAENRRRLFDPFFTTKEVGDGTGLGLSMCFGIVQSHRGRLYVEDAPERGATFVLELPVQTSAAKAAETAAGMT